MLLDDRTGDIAQRSRDAHGPVHSAVFARLFALSFIGVLALLLHARDNNGIGEWKPGLLI